MANSYTVTEFGIAHEIALNGPTVFALPDGRACIRYMGPGKHLFHPIEPDQSFWEVVRLRQQARGSSTPLPEPG